MESDIEQNIFWLLIRASIPAKQAFAQTGELFGLTRMQLFTLCLIDKDKGVAMNDITRVMGCDASNVTGLVDKLVSQGLIDRSECARDRRIKIIQLTEKGRRTRNLIMREFASAKIDTFAEMTPEELATLRQLLTKALATCQTPKSSSAA